jgi:leucyl aminopeptidase (aminopeptidase T)
MDGETERLVAERIVTEVLAMRPDEKLLLLFDVFGFPVTNILAQAALSKGATFSARLMPLGAQLAFSKKAGLPADVDYLLSWCDALVFMVADHEDATRFRVEVLNRIVSGGKRALHLPGVDTTLLCQSLAGVDLGQLRAMATSLRTKVNKVETIRIVTEDLTGRQHTLVLSSEGRQAHADVGVCSSGSIAQLPAGEVYLAPKENSAVGVLALNGAAPDRVFRRNDEVLLEFAEGRLDMDRSRFANTVQCKGFRDELRQYAAQDARNLVLGEFGIGLNAGVDRLSGKPISDEKALGTAHVALGCNTPFGGSNECDCHLDLIFCPIEVRLNTKALPWSWGLR